MLTFGKLKEDVDFKPSRRRLKSCNFGRFCAGFGSKPPVFNDFCFVNF